MGCLTPGWQWKLLTLGLSPEPAGGAGSPEIQVGPRHREVEQGMCLVSRRVDPRARLLVSEQFVDDLVHRAHRSRHEEPVVAGDLLRCEVRRVACRDETIAQTESLTELFAQHRAMGHDVEPISAHQGTFQSKVSKETIIRITDQVIETMSEWQNRPFDPVLFIDAIGVKIREGQVANRPIYVAIGVTLHGERDIVGLWAGEGGAGAKYWLHVLTEVNVVWRQTIVQTCVVHLLRNSFRYASKQHWPAIAKDLKPIYTARMEAATLDRRAEFAERWEARYPAIVKLWENAWAEFVPFLSFHADVRAVTYTTDEIVSRVQQNK